MTQADFYTVENTQKVDGNEFFFKIIKVTDNFNGEIVFRAIPHDTETGDKLQMMPTYSSAKLQQVINYAEQSVKA